MKKRKKRGPGKRKKKMEGNIETIGEVIRNARLRKKIKVGQAAEACEVSRPHWHTWEKSEYILPKNFTRIAGALGLSRKRLVKANGPR